MLSNEAWMDRVRTIMMLSRQAEFLGDGDADIAMPPAGAEHRGRDVAMLRALRRELLLGHEFAAACRKIEEDGDGPEGDRAYARYLLRQVAFARAETPDLLRRTEIQRQRTHAAWGEAKGSGELNELLIELGKLIELRRELANARMREMPEMGFAEPYDALLDEFEPGLTAEAFEAILAETIPGVVDLVARATSCDAHPKSAAELGLKPGDVARNFALAVTRDMGVHADRVAIEIVGHPMCLSLSTHDVRLCLRSAARSFEDECTSAIHEGGHATYEMGFGDEAFRTPDAEAASYGAHESISRFWEVMIGRGREFWQAYLPMLKFMMPKAADLTVEQLFGAFNVVKPSFIRTQADPVSYVMHIALRFRIERRLINGDLDVADIEQAWNDGMEELLGIRPDTPQNGFLQDVHWFIGYFGYFPTYVIGTLAAAMLLEQLQQHGFPEDGFVNALHARDLASVTAWLRDTIFRHGARFTGLELIRRATGRDVNPDAFLRVMRTRLEATYGLTD